MLSGNGTIDYSVDVHTPGTEKAFSAYVGFYDLTLTQWKITELTTHGPTKHGLIQQNIQFLGVVGKHKDVLKKG